MGVETLDKEGAEPRVTQEVSIRSRSVICCLRNRIRCSCSVAWISASLTRDRAIFRSAETCNERDSVKPFMIRMFSFRQDLYLNVK